VEIGASLMNVGSGGKNTPKAGGSSGGDGGGGGGSGSGSGGSGLMARPEVKAAGGVGMEILRVRGSCGRELQQGLRMAGTYCRVGCLVCV
jgi:hypothetical protein